jgi:hypothetical protein
MGLTVLVQYQPHEILSVYFEAPNNAALDVKDGVIHWEVRFAPAVQSVEELRALLLGTRICFFSALFI